MRDDVFCFFSRSISDAQCAFSFRLPHVLHCCLCLRLYVAIVYKFAFILLYADYVIYANCAIYARLFYTVILPAFVIFYVPSRWKTKAATHNWLNRRFIVMRGGYKNRVPKSGVSRLVFQRGGTVVLIESLMNQKIRSKKGNDRYEHFTRTLSWPKDKYCCLKR